jgi:hypothetical protein
MNKDNAKRILAIQVEMGMMVMSLMSQADLDDKTERMTLHVLSAMQGETAILLNLTMEDVKEVWRETKCGIRDLKANMTPEQAEELSKILLDGEEAKA